MILTKQLQVVIESSLAQGRDYEDIREILMKQGFQDADISEIFSQYRGAQPAPAAPAQTPQTTNQTPVDTDLGLVKPQIETAPVPPPVTPTKAQEQIQNQNFAKPVMQSEVLSEIKTETEIKPASEPEPVVKPGFVPVGFEKEDSAQANVKDEVDTFMNVGTNTQTAAHRMNQERGLETEKKERLPAPGTTLLPSEMNTAVSTPKVINETGAVQGEVTVTQPVAVPTKIQAQQYINVGFAGMPEMERVLFEEKTKNIEKSPWPLVLVLIFLISLFGGFFYWFFFINSQLEPSSEILDQLVVPEPEAPVEPEYTGPRDPFTNEPLETQ